MKFKVECRRPVAQPSNPFVPGCVWGKGQVRVRTWEMECADEGEVRRFFDEAKAADHPNVRGFELQSIVPLPNAGGQIPPASGGNLDRLVGGQNEH